MKTMKIIAFDKIFFDSGSLSVALAVPLLKFKYHQAEIKAVNSRDIILLDYLQNPQIILIDVGGQYNPELKNYDGSGNDALPCGLILMLLNEFSVDFKWYDIYTNEILRILNVYQKAKLYYYADDYEFDDEQDLIYYKLNIHLDYKDIFKLFILSYLDIMKEPAKTGEIIFNSLLKYKRFKPWLRYIYKKFEKMGLTENGKAHHQGLYYPERDI
jgi:hypothetical protein